MQEVAGQISDDEMQCIVFLITSDVDVAERLCNAIQSQRRTEKSRSSAQSIFRLFYEKFPLGLHVRILAALQHVGHLWNYYQSLNKRIRPKLPKYHYDKAERHLVECQYQYLVRSRFFEI